MHVFDEVPLEPKFYLIVGDSSLTTEFTSYLLVKRAPSLVVDGGNSFSPFSLSTFCRILGRDVMDAIFVSRAFTVFQLKTLITKSLPSFIERESPSLIVISHFSDLFHSDDVEEEVLQFLHERLLSRLKEMVKKYGVPIIVKEHSSGRMGAGLFDYRVLLKTKGSTLLLSVNQKRLRATLIPASQKTLECRRCQDG
jgi:hypothetical protein